MTTTAIVSILCPDKTGLVSDIASCLFDLGANLADTTFAVLGTGAEFTSVCEFDTEIALDTIEGQLRSFPGLEEAEISVKAFDLELDHGPSGNMTHRIIVRGGDRPGLIARMSEVLVQYDANIVRLNSVRQPGKEGTDYMVTFSVWLPPQKVNGCLTAMNNTAGELGLTFKTYELKH